MWSTLTQFDSGSAPKNIFSSVTRGGEWVATPVSEKNRKFFLLENVKFCDVTAQNSKFFTPAAPIGTAGPTFLY